MQLVSSLFRPRLVSAAALAAILVMPLVGCGEADVSSSTRQGAISLRSAMDSASRGIDNVRPTRASLDNLSSSLRDSTDQTGDVIAILTPLGDDPAAALLLDAARKQRSFLQDAQTAASATKRSTALASVAQARTAGTAASEAYSAVTRDFADLAGVVPASTTFAVGRLRDATSSALKRPAASKKNSVSRGKVTNPAPSGSDCGAGISVNAATSCPFARNVASAYAESGGSTIEVWSPVTGRYYTMNCSGAMPVVCTGGNNARVEIR